MHCLIVWRMHNLSKHRFRAHIHTCIATHPEVKGDGSSSSNTTTLYGRHKSLLAYDGCYLHNITAVGARNRLLYWHACRRLQSFRRRWRTVLTLKTIPVYTAGIYTRCKEPRVLVFAEATCMRNWTTRKWVFDSSSCFLLPCVTSVVLGAYLQPIFTICYTHMSLSYPPLSPSTDGCMHYVMVPILALIGRYPPALPSSILYNSNSLASHSTAMRAEGVRHHAQNAQHFIIMQPTPWRHTLTKGPNYTAKPLPISTAERTIWRRLSGVGCLAITNSWCSYFFTSWWNL